MADRPLMTDSRRVGPSYQPALDGLRAVSVTLVLLFHAGFGWMPAGYLGVSVFFTLSGFLITRLMLAELDRTGGLSLGRFYGRRLARLAPASLLCLLGVLVAYAFGAFRSVPGLRDDALGAMLHVFNWVQLAGSGSYSDLFAGGELHVTSPLEHYWSLAIEEQFYWLWPVVIVLVARRARGRGRSVTAAVVALTVLFTVVAPVVAAAAGPDAAYWATPARLAEILVGASLACLLRHRPGVPAGVRRAGPAGLGAIVALSALLPSGSGPAYDGLLPLLAVLSGVVLWSLQTDGALQRILAVAPLPGLGRISYGLYLYHWPVFVLLRERGWDVHTAGGFLVATSLTTAAAVASYRFVEMPIRRGGWRPPRVFAGVGLATVAACSVVVVTVHRGDPLVERDVALLEAASIEPAASVVPLARTAFPSAAPPAAAPATPTSVTSTTTVGPATTTGSTSTTVGVPSSTAAAPVASTIATDVDLPSAGNRPIRVLVVGDSTAADLGVGLAAWSSEHPAHAQVSTLWSPGFGILLDGTVTSFGGVDFTDDSRTMLEETMPASIAELLPDIVVFMTTLGDAATREWDPAEGPLGPTDPRFRRRLAEAYADVTERVLGLGVARVAWVVPPRPTVTWLDDVAMRDPARWAAHHDVIRDLASRWPDAVRAIDLAAWLHTTGLDVDESWRPDGMHLTTDAAAEVVERFVGPSLVRFALG